MRTLWNDLRYGLRLLGRSPGFTAIALLTLTLGIGATAAIFSVVDAVLLRPLAFREPDRLVMVYEDASSVGFPFNTPAPGNYVDWKAQSQVFEDAAALSWGSYSLTDPGAEPEEVMSVLNDYHETLGALIDRYEATLERFAGDGMLILFNDPLPCPGHAERAVRMALDMMAAIKARAVVWRKRGHELGFGIGIALGYATLGRIGFARRFD